MQHRTRMVDIMQGSRALRAHGCQEGTAEAWDPYRERGDRIISEKKQETMIWESRTSLEQIG
eukprot:4309524-Heterocapsa_arctica.AAC.1